MLIVSSSNCDPLRRIMSGDDASTGTLVDATAPSKKQMSATRKRHAVVRFNDDCVQYHDSHLFEDEVQQCWHLATEYKEFKRQSMRHVKRPAQGDESALNYDRWLKQVYGVASNAPFVSNSTAEPSRMSLEAMFRNPAQRHAFVNSLQMAGDRFGLERWIYCPSRFALRRVIQDAVIDMQDAHMAQCNQRHDEEIAAEARSLSWPCRLFSTLVAQALARCLQSDEDNEDDEEYGSSCWETDEDDATSATDATTSTVKSVRNPHQVMVANEALSSASNHSTSSLMKSKAKKLWKKVKKTRGGVKDKN